MHSFQLTIITLITLLLSACSGQQPIKTKILDHRDQHDVSNYLANIQPGVMNKHQKLSFDQFINQVIKSRAIFVGEIHDRYDNHLIQLAVLKALHQKNANIAIGVEWFQQPYQWVVNRYLNGSFTEKQLLEKAEYYKRWHYRYAMLRPILLYAKQNKIPVIALNASVELTKKISKSGITSLKPHERRQLPKIIHPPEKAYRKKLEDVFKYHSTDKKRLENFITVQRVWDETMAMNTAKFLKSQPNHKIIVFAGNGHISDNVSIPADLKRQLDVPTATISSGETKERREVGAVDYFVINDAVSLPKLGRMGVMLESKNNRVLIGGLSKKGAAEKAGLQKGDRFISINQQTIHNLTDFKLLLADKKPNERINVKILRVNEKRQELSVQLTLM